MSEHISLDDDNWENKLCLVADECHYLDLPNSSEKLKNEIRDTLPMNPVICKPPNYISFLSDYKQAIQMSGLNNCIVAFRSGHVKPYNTAFDVLRSDSLVVVFYD